MVGGDGVEPGLDVRAADGVERAGKPVVQISVGLVAVELVGPLRAVGVPGRLTRRRDGDWRGQTGGLLKVAIGKAILFNLQDFAAVSDGIEVAARGGGARFRDQAKKLPGCAVRTVSAAMLSRKCSGRRRSHTARDVWTRAK